MCPNPRWLQRWAKTAKLNKLFIISLFHIDMPCCVLLNSSRVYNTVCTVYTTFPVLLDANGTHISNEISCYLWSLPHARELWRAIVCMFLGSNNTYRSRCVVLVSVGLESSQLAGINTISLTAQYDGFKPDFKVSGDLLCLTHRHTRIIEGKPLIYLPL